MKSTIENLIELRKDSEKRFNEYLDHIASNYPELDGSVEQIKTDHIVILNLAITEVICTGRLLS